MIYLLIVDHYVQFGKDTELSPIFVDYLVEKISDLHITLIGEEASTEDLVSAAIDPLVKKAAQRTNVDYVPCDPSDAERSQKNILTSHQISQRMELLKEAGAKGIFPKEEFKHFKKEMKENEEKREAFWFKKVEGRITENIIFVLAAGHISSHVSSRGEGFDTLLKKKGVKFEILPERFLGEEFK